MHQKAGLTMLAQLRALIIKEFIAIWQDKRSRFSLIGPPIIQFFIFTFAATLDVHNVAIGIYNNDAGEPSYEFIQRLKGSQEFTNFILLNNKEEMTRSIEEGTILAAIQINEDFSRKVLANKTGDIFVVTDGRKSNASQIVLGYISDIADNFNTYLLGRTSLRKPRSELIQRNWYNPNLIYTWFTLTGLVGVLTMLTSFSITSLSIAREKEMGTFEQLLASPLNPMLILVGKAAPALIIGILEGTGMMIAGIIFLGLPIRGHLILFYPGMIVFVLAIAGIGLFISTLSNTQQQSTMGAFLFLSPMVILSGFATPVENMPGWLQYIAMLNPLKYFLIIVRGICLKNISPHTVFDNVWPMLLIAACTLTFSTWFFRSKVG